MTGKMCPRTATVDFHLFLIRESKTAKVCHFYIVCAVGILLSLHNYKVMVILCLQILLTGKYYNVPALDLLFCPFLVCACGLSYHLFHILSHSVRFFQHFEALLSFSCVAGLFSVLIGVF